MSTEEIRPPYETESGRQRGLADLGLSALEGRPLSKLVEEASDLVHAALEEIAFVSVLELLPRGDAFAIRGGSEWVREAIGTEVPFDASLAGATVRADGVVVVEEGFEDDPRFDTPSILIDHGAESGASVVIYGRRGPVGAMGAFRRTPGSFGADEIHFLQSIANTIGLAMERQELEERLVRSRKLAAMERFVGGMAHQFNNILTAVLGHAHLLVSGLDETDPKRESAEEIVSAGQRAAVLVERLLAFGKEGQTRPVEIDVGEAIESLVPALEHLVPESVSIETDLEADLPMVRVDPDHFERMVLQLVLNAREAMPEGGDLTVAVRTVDLDSQRVTRLDLEPGRYVRVSVRDRGSGMSAGTRDRAFEPFFTTRDVGEGVGMGLSEVYGMALSAGGSVHLESEPGRGTLAMVHLPVASPVEDLGRDPIPGRDPRRHPSSADG